MIDPLELVTEFAKRAFDYSEKGFVLPQDKAHKWLVLQGDWGGQIYLTAPLWQIRAESSAVMELLKQLDKLCWDCNDGEGHSAYVCYVAPDAPEQEYGVWGGMGGGTLSSGLWLTAELLPNPKNAGSWAIPPSRNFVQAIKRLLFKGGLSRIPTSLLPKSAWQT